MILAFYSSTKVNGDKPQNQSIFLQENDSYILDVNNVETISSNISYIHTKFFDKDIFSDFYETNISANENPRFLDLVLINDTRNFFCLFTDSFIIFYMVDQITSFITKSNIIFIKDILAGKFKGYEIAALAMIQDMLIFDLIGPKGTSTTFSLKLNINVDKSSIMFDESSYSVIFDNLANPPQCSVTFKTKGTVMIRFCPGIINTSVFYISFDESTKVNITKYFNNKIIYDIDFLSEEILILNLDNFLYRFSVLENFLIKLIQENSITYISSFKETIFFLTHANILFILHKNDLTKSFEIEYKDYTYCEFFMKDVIGNIFYCEDEKTNQIEFFDVYKGSIQMVPPHKYKITAIKQYVIENLYIFIFKDQKEYHYNVIELTKTKYKLTFTKNNQNCEYYITDCFEAYVKTNSINYRFFLLEQVLQSSFLVKKDNMKMVYNKFTYDNNYLYLSDYFYGFIDDLSFSDEQLKEIKRMQESSGFELDYKKELSVSMKNSFSKILIEKVFFINEDIVWIVLYPTSIIKPTEDIKVKLNFFDKNTGEEIDSFNSSITGSVDNVLKIGFYKNNIYIVYEFKNQPFFCFIDIHKTTSCVDKKIFTDPFFTKRYEFIENNINDSDFLLYFIYRLANARYLIFKIASEDFRIFKNESFNVYLEKGIHSIQVFNYKLFDAFCFISDKSIYLSINTNTLRYLKTIDLANNAFYINETHFIVLNFDTRQISFINMFSGDITQRNVYFNYPFSNIQKRSLIQRVDQFIVVQAIINGEQFLCNLMITDNNPYIGFKFPKMNLDHSKSGYTCSTIECYFFFVQNNRSTKSLTLFKSSYYLIYKLGNNSLQTFKDNNQYNTDQVLVSFFIMINKINDFSFIDKFTVLIASNFFIHKKSDIITIETNTNQINLLDSFEGNIFGFRISFKNIDEWICDVNADKNGLDIFNPQNNSRIAYKPFFFYDISFKEKDSSVDEREWAAFVELAKTYFLGIFKNGQLIFFNIENGVTRRLALIDIDNPTAFTNCTMISYISKTIFIFCDNVLYKSELAQDLFDIKEFVHFKTKFVAYAAYYVGDIKAIQKDFLITNFHKKIKIYKYEDGFKSFQTIDKINPVFDIYQIDVVYLTETRVLFYFLLENELLVILIDNSTIKSQHSIYFDSVMKKFFLSKNDPLELSLVENNSVGYISLLIDEDFEITHFYRYLFPITLFDNFNYLDAIVSNNYLLIMSYDKFNKIVYLTAQNVNGEIKSYIEYDNYDNNEFKIICFDEENGFIYITSSDNIINKVKVNWGYWLQINFQSKESLEDLTLKVYNPFYIVNSKIGISVFQIEGTFTYILFLLENYYFELSIFGAYFLIFLIHYMRQNKK